MFNLEIFFINMHSFWTSGLQANPVALAQRHVAAGAPCRARVAPRPGPGAPCPGPGAAAARGSRSERGAAAAAAPGTGRGTCPRAIGMLEDDGRGTLHVDR